MTAIHILVVDNSADHRKEVRDELIQGGGGKFWVHEAADASSAIRMIDAEFFHLAFVDLKLAQDFNSGFEVLQALRERQPHCDRVAMTRFVGANPHEALRVVSPLDRLAHALISKQSLLGAEFLNVALRRYREIAEWPFCLSGLSDILANLGVRSRIFKGSSRTPESIETEVLTLLGDIMRPRIKGSGVNEEILVNLETTTQGFSGAVAFLCSPQFGNRPGSRFFVKIGRGNSIRQEAERFQSFVQLNVPLKFRVELLGYSTGASLGAVAYSIAGGSTAGLESLDTLATRDGPARESVQSVLSKLFEKESSSWYRARGDQASPIAFFQNELGTNFFARQDHIRRLCNRLARKYGGRFELPSGIDDDGPSRLTIGECELLVPSEPLLGRDEFRRRVSTCLVHGDLHGGNVLISSDGGVHLIDFAHAGYGPFSLDAAILNGSVRLWDAERIATLHAEIGDGTWEELRLTCRDELRRARALLGERVGSETVQDWESTAQLIDDGLAEQFGEELSRGSTPLVYMLQATRLLSLPLTDFALLRVLAWFTGLVQASSGQDTSRHGFISKSGASRSRV